MTRWHEDDLGGRLLRDMEEGGDQWTVLSLPAIAEDPSREYDPGSGLPEWLYMQPDPLDRPPGDALWPEWENETALMRKRTVVGEVEWSAQYQQRPAPGSGTIFQTDSIRQVQTLPAKPVLVARGWDLAATEQVGTRDPDWTVGVKMAVLEDGSFAVLDVKRIRGTPNEVEALVVATAGEDGYDVAIDLPQDPGQAGKSQIHYLVGKLAGYTVYSSVETGDKATRAMPYASQVEVGNVLVLLRHWTRTYIAELKSFPSGSKDDQVDASSRAFTRIVGRTGAENILEFYKKMAGKVASPDRSDSQSRPSLHVVGGTDSGLDPDAQELIDVYRATRAGEDMDSKPQCAYCDGEIGNSYATDGVSRWHTHCPQIPKPIRA